MIYYKIFIMICMWDSIPSVHCHYFYPKFLISIYHSMLYLTQRRGEAEFAEVIPLLEHVFVFTNWVK